jgi:hypothetical protein
MNPNLSSATRSYNITGNGTTTLNVPNNPLGKLILIALVINTKGGSSNTAKIYDSNESIGANSDYLKATLDTTDRVGRVDYGIPMTNGIYIVTSAGTAADITVLYA